MINIIYNLETENINKPLDLLVLKMHRHKTQNLTVFKKLFNCRLHQVPSACHRFEPEMHIKINP